ncbi:MAG TPA: hypothetical protein VGG46_08920 [Terriglobales bacterium]|jgi:hypothetical protein
MPAKIIKSDADRLHELRRTNRGQVNALRHEIVERDQWIAQQGLRIRHLEKIYFELAKYAEQFITKETTNVRS